MLVTAVVGGPARGEGSGPGPAVTGVGQEPVVVAVLPWSVRTAPLARLPSLSGERHAGVLGERVSVDHLKGLIVCQYAYF